MSKLTSLVPVVLVRVPMRLRLYTNALFLIGGRGSICWGKGVSKWFDDGSKNSSYSPFTALALEG